MVWLLRLPALARVLDTSEGASHVGLDTLGQIGLELESFLRRVIGECALLQRPPPPQGASQAQHPGPEADSDVPEAVTEETVISVLARIAPNLLGQASQFDPSQARRQLARERIAQLSTEYDPPTLWGHSGDSHPKPAGLLGVTPKSIFEYAQASEQSQSERARVKHDAGLARGDRMTLRLKRGAGIQEEDEFCHAFAQPRKRARLPSVVATGPPEGRHQEPRPRGPRTPPRATATGWDERSPVRGSGTSMREPSIQELESPSTPPRVRDIGATEEDPDPLAWLAGVDEGELEENGEPEEYQNTDRDPPAKENDPDPLAWLAGADGDEEEEKEERVELEEGREEPMDEHQDVQSDVPMDEDQPAGQEGEQELNADEHAPHPDEQEEGEREDDQGLHDSDLSSVYSDDALYQSDSLASMLLGTGKDLPHVPGQKDKRVPTLCFNWTRPTLPSGPAKEGQEEMDHDGDEGKEEPYAASVHLWPPVQGWYDDSEQEEERTDTQDSKLDQQFDAELQAFYGMQ